MLFTDVNFTCLIAENSLTTMHVWFISDRMFLCTLPEKTTTTKLPCHTACSQLFGSFYVHMHH